MKGEGSRHAQLSGALLHHVCRRTLPRIYQSRYTGVLEANRASFVSKPRKQGRFANASIARNRDDIVCGMFGLEDVLNKEAQFIGSANKDVAGLDLRSERLLDEGHGTKTSFPVRRETPMELKTPLSPYPLNYYLAHLLRTSAGTA
jgi:hypothetical protein